MLLSVRDVDMMIERLVPQGTPASRAAAILDAHGIARGPYDPQDRTMLTKITDPHSPLIVAHAFQVSFAFDAQNNLVSHTTHEVFTGP